MRFRALVGVRGRTGQCVGVDWQIVAWHSFIMLALLVLVTTLQGKSESPSADEETEARQANSSSHGHLARHWWGCALEPPPRSTQPPHQRALGGSSRPSSMSVLAGQGRAWKRRVQPH